jgi:hypothetical protein
MAQSSNDADTTGMYDAGTSVLHGGAMEEKTARKLPGQTVLGVLLLVMSGALLAVDVGVTRTVHADSSLPRFADFELASSAHIAEVTTPVAQRITSACKLCDSSQSGTQVHAARVPPLRRRQ